MKLVTSINSVSDLETLRSESCPDVLIGTRELSRYGQLNASEARDLAALAVAYGFRPILDWDILLTENQFRPAVDFYHREFKGIFPLVRVSDPGVLQELLDHDRANIQFNCEMGNHNLEALKGWAEHCGPRLDRLVLSIELPFEKIREYAGALPVPLEILGLGRILLFYSPRSLVTPVLDDQDGANWQRVHESIEIEANSEESPHRGFPVIENRHGTFMFNPKDFCLVEHIEKLTTAGLAFFRVDPLTLIHENFGLLEKLFDHPSESDFQNLKKQLPRPVIRGYFHQNKSDVLFKKLKNNCTQRVDQGFVGKVLDVEKGKFITIKIESLKISRGDFLNIFTPDGKKKTVQLNQIFNSSLQEVEACDVGQLALIATVSGVSVKSMAYLTEPVMGRSKDVVI